MMITSWIKINYQKGYTLTLKALRRMVGWAIILYFIAAVTLALWYFMGNAFYHHYYFFSKISFEHTVGLLKRLVCWQ
ncbi:hypothetical protein [Dendrosporobacter sp. 1207_IL3150]|uniref:hypothetical protein n=1 Tax=Dendrosporobacter sp. 1207_IL3150 TaxID=3084054 RepID=UPI002FDB10BB